MKRVKYWLLALIVLFPLNMTGQSGCAVLKPEIDSLYVGECKKGLANGEGEAWGRDYYKGQFKKGLPERKGTYYFADGSVYTGSFLKGERNGRGEFKTNRNGKDTLITGMWEKDIYVGKEDTDPGYNITTERSADRVKVYQRGDENMVHFVVRSTHGTSELAGMSYSCTSGSEFNLGKDYGFRYMQLPYTVNIRFETWNKMRTGRILVEVTVTFTKVGNWYIEIDV